MASLLEVEGLRAYYGQTQALHDVSFSLEAGGITTLLGANGAGKTTTLRSICNMVHTEGSIRLDGTPIKSCTFFAVQANGREITTVEGMMQNGALHPVQQGFKTEHGLQCGFCTPGMMLVSAALLEENPDPSEEEIRWAISGNICRCTGYQNIVKAVQWAAKNPGA